MVIIFDIQVAVTPAGKVVAVPIPVAPVVVCVIAVNGVLIHKVGVELATEAVLSALTVAVTAVRVTDSQPVVRFLASA